MTQEQLDLLFAYIEMKIREYGAVDSSDGGLIESIRVSELKEKLLATIKEED